MTRPYARFIFEPDVPTKEVEGTLRLAALAAESIHGPDRVQLEASWDLDQQHHVVAIETATEVGRTLAAIFLGYVRREFGPDAVQVVAAQSAGIKAIAGVR